MVEEGKQPQTNKILFKQNALDHFKSAGSFVYIMYSKIGRPVDPQSPTTKK